MPSTRPHVFVCRGDLTSIACDHWLVPAGHRLSVSDYWWTRENCEHLANAGAWGVSSDHLEAVGPTDLSIRDDVPHRPVRELSPDQRIVELETWQIGSAPKPWLVSITPQGSHPVAPHQDLGGADLIDYLVESVAQFVRAAAATDQRFLSQRARPLLAVPIVGTGYGGGRNQAGHLLEKLLPALVASAMAEDVDILLVTWSAEDYAAAQHERRNSNGGLFRWSGLSEAQRTHCAHLASLAKHDQLVLFLGAGVSMGAGLPGWRELLGKLAKKAEIDGELLTRFRSLNLLDQAEYIAHRMEPSDKTIGESIQTIFREYHHYGLAHGLIASLPVNQFVTTNYDTLFERAGHAGGSPITVLPYSPKHSMQRWLLKMHGCVEHPDDIVLTRENYIRYAERNAALSGIVQAMLITKHMLFVGFSLEDDNFIRVVDSVRRAIHRDSDSFAKASLDAGQNPFGTALMLVDSPLHQELWEQDIDWLSLRADSEESFPESVRRVEIFLDYLGFLSSSQRHLLSPRFDGVLEPDDQKLRDLLLPLLNAPEEARSAAAWPMVANMLKSLGANHDE